MSDDLIIPGGGNSEEPEEKSKIHVDDDWKAQAQAEKEKLAAQAEEESAQGGQQGIPPADLKTLASQLVTQALLYMGAIPEPQTGRRIAHLELAQFNIDLLTMLKEKTEGNRDEEEEELLTQAVDELTASFAQLEEQLKAQQQMGGGAPGANPLDPSAGAQGGPGGPGGPGGIIT